MFEITLQIEPESKLRARMGRYGAYTPQKTVNAERAIRALVRLARPQPFKKGVPLHMEVTFYLTRPKSVKTRYPVVRPDCDNILKCVCDALNKELWHDDAQIVSIVATKRYAKKGFIKLKVLEFSESVEE